MTASNIRFNRIMKLATIVTTLSLSKTHLQVLPTVSDIISQLRTVKWREDASLRSQVTLINHREHRQRTPITPFLNPHAIKSPSQAQLTTDVKTTKNKHLAKLKRLKAKWIIHNRMQATQIPSNKSSMETSKERTLIKLSDRIPKGAKELSRRRIRVGK